VFWIPHGFDSVRAALAEAFAAEWSAVWWGLSAKEDFAG